MSKEKTPFERTAAALKVMGKKIAAKKTDPRRELQCVWIANHSGHAVATDGHVLAYLDAYDLETPWPFWSQRDYRTLQAVFPFLKAEEKNGEKHNALEDARAQMRGLEHFMSLEAVFKEKPKNINKVTG